MACFHPLTAYQSDSGEIYFHDVGHKELKLPCGQCIGCRLERSRQWAMRIIHEASMYDNNCFITLTYSPENLPPDGGLRKKHFQLFMKRLRKKLKKKFGTIIAENMATIQTGLTIMLSSLTIILMIGNIYSIHLVERRYTHQNN